MSWLFPDSALEEDIVECVEYSMAMEGMFTDAFRRNFSARKEMKPHKRAMNKAILAGDYKTASKEAEECARILRDAADEIKNTSPSMLSTIITDIALFTAIELSQIIFVIKIGQADRKQTIEKYAELDAKLVSMEYDDREIPVLAMKYRKEYSETAEYMQKLNEKIQSLVKEGKPVPARMRDMDANRFFLSKVVGAERDGALKKNQKATNAGIATSVFATGLSMLVNQVISLKRAKDGKIPPADVNGILKTCYRSLNQTADAYEKKAREYEFIGNGFESDMAAQEGFFSNIKSNMQAKAAATKAKIARDNELNTYFMEMESKLDNLYGDSGTETMLKYYVEYCSDKLVKGASSAMAKLLKAFPTFELNQKDPWIYSNSGYVFLVSEPNDGDDSPLVWLPTKANVDKVARGDLEGAEYVELWGSDTGCPYVDICDAYAQKKYAEAHPDSATESWLFSESAQEGWLSDKVGNAIVRAQMKSSEQLRQQKSSDEKKRIDAAKKALELKTPKEVVAQFIQSGMAQAAVQRDLDYGNGGRKRDNLMVSGSKAKSICSSKPNDDENFEYCWDAVNVSKYETFTVGDISVVIAYVGTEPAGIGIPLSTMVLRTSEGYVEGTKAEVMKDPDLKENYEYGEYMESYFTPVTWNQVLLKVAESITPATESEVVSSMGELEKAQAFISAWLECHADDMEPLYGPEADILLKEFRAKHVAEELKEDPDYVDPHEERHCGRLIYLVEVKPDTTNITIPVCWNNRNTTVEYGSKEIEESLSRYYDMAVQPQDGEIITEPAQEGIISKYMNWHGRMMDKYYRPKTTAALAEYRQDKKRVVAPPHTPDPIRQKAIEKVNELFDDFSTADSGCKEFVHYMLTTKNENQEAIRAGWKDIGPYVVKGEEGSKIVKAYVDEWSDGQKYRMNRVDGVYFAIVDGGRDGFWTVIPVKKGYFQTHPDEQAFVSDYMDMLKTMEWKYYQEMQSTEPATEGWAQNLAKKSLSKSNQIFVPKRVKEKQSAMRKDINAQTKANLQQAGDTKRFFNVVAQVIYPQKGWIFGPDGEARCREIAARQTKNTDRVISAEVQNYSNLHYVLVHTKEPGYNEWVMYIPQVSGVKTRNLHQAAREIALIQSGKNGKTVPGFESNISFG